MKVTLGVFIILDAAYTARIIYLFARYNVEGGFTLLMIDITLWAGTIFLGSLVFFITKSVKTNHN
jgi:hypothetical protein